MQQQCSSSAQLFCPPQTASIRACHPARQWSLSNSRRRREFPPRPKPCTPSKARRTRRRFQHNAHTRFCRCAGCPVRGSRICRPFTARPEPLNEPFFSNGGAPANRHRPVRTTSRRFPAARRPRECCCRRRRAETPGSPTRAKFPPCGRAQNPCQSRRDQIPASRRRSGWKILLPQRPQRRCRLRLQCGGGDGKCAARGELHFFCDFKAGKNRLAQTQCFAGRKLCDPGNLAVRAKPAQVRFQFVRQCKRRLRRLRGVGFFLAGDAHLKLRRHRMMVENMDMAGSTRGSHRIGRLAATIKSAARSAATPKNSGRKFFNCSASLSGHIRRGDEKIRRAGFLSGLPEADLRKFPQIPRQRPRIGGDDGDARI